MNRDRRNALLVTLSLAALGLGEVAALAQDKYPSRPIRVVSSTGTGSGPDVIARIIFDHMSRELGQQLVMENNPTGGGLVAAQQVAGATPDGYTLMSPSASVFTVLPMRQERAPRLGQQLTAVAYYGDMTLVVCVSPSLGVNTLQELVDLVKRDPKKVLYAGNTNGSLPHMSGVLLNSRLGGGLTFVPYRSSADGLKDLLSGQINMIIEGVASLHGAIQAGSIKPLAMTMAQRAPNWPQIPTVGELLDGYAAQGWAGLAAPAGTPEAIVNRLNAVHNKVITRPDVKERLAELGTYIRPLDPAAFRTYIEGEQELWWPIVREVAGQQAAGQK